MLLLKNLKTVNKSNKLYIQKISLILAAFLFSYLIRISQINAPLNSLEYITSHSLITIELMYQKGLQALNWSPRYTYNSIADKNIPNLGGIQDSEKNYYYISYPPFTFLFPYMVFKVLQIYPSPIALRTLNIGLHFICSVFILILLLTILRGKKNILFLASYAGFLLYLVSPGNVLFHTNYYFADILAQLFFLSGLYFFVKYDTTVKNKMLWLVGLFGSLFLLCYTEWIGYIFGLILWSIVIISNYTKREKLLFTLLFFCILCLVFSITLLEYSSISSTHNVIKELLMKYSVRSGYDAFSSSENLTVFNFKSYLNILYFYYTYYFYPIILLIGVLLSYLFLCKIKNIDIFNSLEKKIIILSLLPVLLHYLFFMNFNSLHSFSTLKLSIFLCLALGIFIFKIAKINQIYLFICIGTIFFISLYHPYMPPVPINDFSYMNMGEYIKQDARSDEVVFICNDPAGFIQPQIVYYAKRNILYCNNREEAKKEIVDQKIGKSVIYYSDSNRNITHNERL